MSGHKEGHKQTFEEEIIPRAICFTIQHNDELRFKKNNLSGRKLSKLLTSNVTTLNLALQSLPVK